MTTKEGWGQLKRWAGILALIFLIYVLQTTVIQEIAIGGVSPNLYIILLAAVSYRYGKLPGMAAGFLTGLMVDLVEGDVIGLYALIYMVIGYLLGFANKIYYQDDTTIPLFLVGASDFVFNFYVYVCAFLLRNRLHLMFYLRTIMLPELLYTVVLSIFLYRLIHKILKLLGPKGQEEGNA